MTASQKMINWGLFSAKSLEFIERPINQDAFITILDGSVRSSKTVSCLVKFIEYCKHGPAGTIAITGVSKQTVKRNFLNDLFDTVGRESYKYNASTGELFILGRSCQVIGIKDEGSEKYIRGGTYAGWFGDEATTTPKSSFYQMLNRLSIPGAKAYLTTNPDNPYHYLYIEYMTDEEKIKSGMVRRIHFTLDDNLNLTEYYKKTISSAYSGVFHKRFIDGLWVAAEGAIYDSFSEEKNTALRSQMPEYYDKIIIGGDYGAGNPTVFLKIGVSMLPTGKPKFFVLDEWYWDAKISGSKTAEQYKQALIDFMGEDKISGVYIDPAAETFEVELLSISCGKIIKTKYVDNSVLLGINSVSTPLDQGRLVIARDRCPETIREIGSYIWDPKAKLKGEDEPLKENDHCMDALRYAIHSAYPSAVMRRARAA